MSVLSSENLWQTEVSYVAEGSYAIEHFPVIVSDEFSFIFYNHPSNRNSEQFYSVARLENESGTIVLNKELEFTGSWVDADLTRSGEVIFAYAPKTISSSTYTTIGIFDEDLDLETYSTFGASEVSPKLLKRIDGSLDVSTYSTVDGKVNIYDLSDTAVVDDTSRNSFSTDWPAYTLSGSENSTIIVSYPTFNEIGAGTDTAFQIINGDRAEISEQHIANIWRAGGQWPYTAVNLSDGSFIIVYDDKNGVVAQKFDYEGNRIGDVSDFSFAKGWYAIDALAIDDGFYVVANTAGTGHLQPELFHFSNNLELIGSVEVDTDVASLAPDTLKLAQLSNNSMLITWSSRAEVTDDLSGLTSYPATLYAKALALNYQVEGSAAIVGETIVGKSLFLQAEDIQDADGLGEFVYSWLTDGVIVDAENRAEYELSSADIGKSITAQISYIDGAGNLETIISQPTEVVRGALGSVAQSLEGDNYNVHLDFSFQNWSQSTNSFALELVYDPTKFDYENVTLVGSGSSSASTNLNAVNNKATLIINGSFSNGADDGTVRLTFTNQLEEADIFLPTITSLSLNSVDQTVFLEPLSLDAAVRNSDPSGQPVIEGTAAIGETLMVNTESITDDDGLGEFFYQWMRDGAAIPGADSATYLVSADDGDAVLSVQIGYTDQLGTVESLTSENTPTIVSPHEYADSFTITSSFGTSVYEGTLPVAEEGSGNQISFTINQIDPQIRSVYVALKPATGQTTDFWDNFWSNKIGGEPADQFALGSFKSVDGGPVTVTYTLNADSVVEENEIFVFSVYEDNMDFALGRKVIKSFEFSVLDDDATLTFTSDLYDRSGEAISGFQLSSSSGSETETYVTGGTGMFEWSSTPGATVEFVSATAYSNSLKAVTSADALDALKLSVGLTPSNGIPNAYDYIAADFNQDGKVTSSDALEILKYAVGLPATEQAEWVFTDTNGDYSGVSKSNTSYTEGVSIAELSADISVSLTGILIGDVNDSYSGLIV